ncbi:hypothetical protein IPN35_02460 [Candidatus Peregrinibacteria bacterium]|nr:MAG: hypothetical protein IPN35_02460 [Candidatus Peregrinibacteria bacterium]
MEKDTKKKEILLDVNSLSRLSCNPQIGRIEEIINTRFLSGPFELYGAFYYGKAGRRRRHDNPQEKWVWLLKYEKVRKLLEIRPTRALLGRVLQRSFSVPKRIEKQDILPLILEGKISESGFHEELRIISFECSQKIFLIILRSSQKGAGRMDCVPMYQGSEEVIIASRP